LEGAHSKHAIKQKMHQIRNPPFSPFHDQTRPNKSP
jgi:hypothetical protein